MEILLIHTTSSLAYHNPAIGIFLLHSIFYWFLYAWSSVAGYSIPALHMHTHIQTAHRNMPLFPLPLFRHIFPVSIFLCYCIILSQAYAFTQIYIHTYIRVHLYVHTSINEKYFVRVLFWSHTLFIHSFNLAFYCYYFSSYRIRAFFCSPRSDLKCHQSIEQTRAKYHVESEK